MPQRDAKQFTHGATRPMNPLKRNALPACLALACAAGLMLPSRAAADFHHWAGTTSSDWFDATNWTNHPGAPVSGDSAFIDASVNPTTINASGAVASAVRVTANGILNIGTSGGLTAAGIQFDGGNGTVNQAGTASVSTLTTTGSTGNIYNLSGGSLDITTSLTLGNGGLINQTGGELILSGGSTNNYLGNSGGSSTYQISGGSLDAAGVNRIILGWFSVGTFRVIGSGATSIKLPYFYVYNTATANADAFIEFDLDNGANHITAITATGTFKEAGNLAVNLRGGVLLSDNASFDLVNSANAITGSYGTGPDALWTTGLTNSNKTLTASLAASENKGTLDPNGTDTLSFAPAALGYVNLWGINPSNPLNILLDVTGGTLSNFTDALTDAGITWAAGSGIYDVQLTLDPSVSGSKYFAWDLSQVDPNMKVSGLSILIPEPATLGLVLLGGVLMLGRRRAAESRG